MVKWSLNNTLLYIYGNIAIFKRMKTERGVIITTAQKNYRTLLAPF